MSLNTKKKYGAESVSQIATFGTMAPRLWSRRRARPDLPYNFVDQLAKLVPFELGMTLKKPVRMSRS
jgi:DNA polymerase-3 subunit alpha